MAGASLRGNGGEPLAGMFKADADAERPSAVPVPEASETEVELSGRFEEGSVYYFVVLPGDLSDGLTLELRDGGGNVWRRQGSSEAVLTAGRVLDLGTVAPDGFAPADGYEKIDGVYHIHTPEGLAAWASAADVLAAASNSRSSCSDSLKSAAASAGGVHASALSSGERRYFGLLQVIRTPCPGHVGAAVFHGLFLHDGERYGPGRVRVRRPHLRQRVYLVLAFGRKLRILRHN